MARRAGRADERPVAMFSQRRRNQTGGHHTALCGWRAKSGRAPTMAMNRVACTNRETRRNQRPGTRFSSTPCRASRAKKTKVLAPARAASEAAVRTVPEGFSCQLPRMSQPKKPAKGAVRDIAYATNTRRSEEHTSELQSLRHLVCR